MPRLLLLDLDGTLVDSFADITDAVNAAFQAVGARASDEAQALSRRGAPLEEFYALAFAAPHDDAGERARFAAFVDAYRGHYLPRCLERTRPYPGVAETLAALTGRAELRLAVVTTKRTETATRILDGTGLSRWLHAIVGSDGLAPKPDPATLRKAASLLGGALDDALMVGDTDRDVGAARAAGCTAVAVTYGGMSRAELEPHRPDHFIDAFREIGALL